MTLAGHLTTLIYIHLIKSLAKITYWLHESLTYHSRKTQITPYAVYKVIFIILLDYFSKLLSITG